MKLQKQKPRQTLNPAFRRQRPGRKEIDLFKQNLLTLLSKIDEIEREENQKNHVRDFLRDTYYKTNNEINTKGSQDLVIHTGKTNHTSVGIIIEAKRPKNTSEWFKGDNANCKAFQELVLYYLRERENLKNIDIKYLIATNIYEWYIFEASYFENLFFKDKQFLKQFQEFDKKQKVTTNTDLFYNDIAKPFINSIDKTIHCAHFDIRDYDKALHSNDKKEDANLIALIKILSPFHLLKVEFADDSNSLKESFYKELLHIIGLEERKDGGKYIIGRKRNGKRNSGSLIENTLTILDAEDPLHKVPDLSIYGTVREEQLYNIALELCITWINRILFLKLLEGQLQNYQQKNVEYLFLNSEMISNYDELHKLFHQVLARTLKERSAPVSQKYKRVPYLNSSLFEVSKLEDITVKINSLDPSLNLPLIENTVLKEIKKKYSELPTLNYLFRFLNAFDFSSEGGEEIQEDENRTLINASVLGKVFEKINGYKDGSIFTPGFITMFMCRNAIRTAVVQKFKDTYKWEIKHFGDLANFLKDRRTTKEILVDNEVINSLHICDPAVGSGHFLVSSLNEIISIKSELGLLADKKGNTLSDYQIVIAQDELIVTDRTGNDFKYEIKNGKPLNNEMQRLQKALFEEKQTIIENCLFGVDINPNSVKICGLRLWIELLKNAYYKEDSNFLELETLPNIDINIKCNNSLISRFALNADLSKALKSIKYDIAAYKGFVNDYKNEKSRDVKRGLEKIIDGIKNDFRTEINKNDPKQIRLSKLSGDLFNLLSQTQMFELDAKEKKLQKERKEKLESEINKLTKEVEEIKSNAVFKNAFEWRFEFPEVLNNDGEFEGFDLIIGNPPYIQLQSLGKEADALEMMNYKTYARMGDIYSLFYEKGNDVLKQNGILSFITSNKWMRAGYGEPTRKYFSEYTNPLLIIDFSGQKVFENVTVDTNILMFQKAKNLKETQACVVTDKFTNNLEEFVNENSSTSTFFTSDSWVILNSIEQTIKEKVDRIGTPLKDWDIQINYGIKTGFNDAFIISGEKKNELIEQDPKSAEIIRPILRGRDIKRYGYEFANLWLINTHNGIKEKGIKPIDVNDYRAIKEHLDKFFPELEKRLDKGYTPYNLRNCAYMEDFFKPKIVWGNLNLNASYALADNNLFVNAPCPMIVPANKYLLAILNSKLADYYIRSLGVTRNGGYFEYKPMFIEKLPVPIISEKEQRPFVKLIEEIEKKGRTDSIIESKIDTLVYQLYGISKEEKERIEIA